MDKWLCLQVQEDPACDYSIACGQKAVIVEADTLEEAQKKAIRESDMNDCLNGDCNPNRYLPGGEQSLKTWKLFKISQEIDLLPLLVMAANSWDEQQAKAKEDAERQQFEKLRKKFER